MPLASASRIGAYEIRSFIGAGGMGEVYRATDSRLKRDVAIKVLPPAFTQDAEHMRRFEFEAQAAGRLNHPNVLSVYDLGVHEGSPYLVSELLEGESLRARLRSGKIPPARVLILPIALGVAINDVDRFPAEPEQRFCIAYDIRAPLRSRHRQGKHHGTR